MRRRPNPELVAILAVLFPLFMFSLGLMVWAAVTGGMGNG